MENSPYTFITGMGRSGTTFLSLLLSLDSNFVVKHEFTGHREFNLGSYYIGKNYSLPFLRKEKIKINKERGQKNFIDVNGYLSDSSGELTEVFEQPQLFHLVRNPLDCCRSLFIRRDDRRMHKLPKNTKEVEDWLNASKLEQICMNWKQTTEDLLNTDATLLRFEDLSNSYQYLNKMLLTPLELDISEEAYNNLKSKKINQTKGKMYRFLYAKWKGKNYNATKSNYQLDHKERQDILRICGDTMSKIGYNENVK